MMNADKNTCDYNFEFITVKVEHPEYGPMEASTTQFNAHKLFCNSEPTNDYIPFKNEMFQKVPNDSVLDFVESSLDKYLESYQEEKYMPDRLPKSAEKQRIYRQNESQSQKEKRLIMARKYNKKRRASESEQERCERLRKQRERIRAIREARKLNPELDLIRRKSEAERMKLRRANETSLQRMSRLEKSKVYSRRRRESEMYRKLENEKNRIAHQVKRNDMKFRILERSKDKMRKKLKRDMDNQKKLQMRVLEI